VLVKKQLKGIKYDKWDFGKVKVFDKPANTPANKKAATTIERMVRGWWARLQFKLKLYQYQLAHPAIMKERAMERMRQNIEKKKQYERKKLEAAHKVDLKKQSKVEKKEEKEILQGKELIESLRKENKKLRDKNDKIIAAAKSLKKQNNRLDGVNEQTDGNMDILEKHAKQIQETHKKLSVVEPKYKASADQMTQVVEQHRQYCLAEHQIKLMYVKLIGTVVDMLEERCKQPGLTDEVVSMVLGMEGKDNQKPLPDKVEEVNGHESFASDGDDDDSDNYDEYTVATLE